VAPTGDIRKASSPLQTVMFGTDIAAELRKAAGGAVGAAIRDVADEGLHVLAIGPTGEVNAEARGADGFLEVWRDWIESFERFEMENVDQTISEDGVLLTHVRQTGWIAGNPIPAEGWAVAVPRGEKLARMELHLDEATARRSAGLER
jgi:hypothetical protein